MVGREKNKEQIYNEIMLKVGVLSDLDLPNNDKEKVEKLLRFRKDHSMTSYRFHKELVNSTNSKTTLMTIMKFQKRS